MTVPGGRQVWLASHSVEARCASDQSKYLTMNIEGLDYNTQREPLMMPEYGREIQKMVDHAIALPTKEERQICAETIVRLMITKVPQLRENADYEQTLWDNLYLMSRKRLDIDWPYDVAGAEKILSKPEPMPLPQKRGHVRLRHYGRLMEELFVQLRDMPDGPERDELVRITANQMKRDLVTWGHGSMDDERVASDLARFTDGSVQINPSRFNFGRIEAMDSADIQRKKRRK